MVVNKLKNYADLFCFVFLLIEFTALYKHLKTLFLLITNRNAIMIYEKFRLRKNNFFFNS